MKIIVLNGNKIHGLKTFFDETQRKLCPDFEDYGRNLDAFNDILWGGFGEYTYGEKLNLVWKDADKSRNALGYEETARYWQEALPKAHSSNTEGIENNVRHARQHAGTTLFVTSYVSLKSMNTSSSFSNRMVGYL